MMDTSPNLILPYIMPAQAQKHVTHNEALRMLDALVQLSILDRDATAPPTTPPDGGRYIVAAGATGAWAGQSGLIAAYQDGAWEFFRPRAGWLAWLVDEATIVTWDGTAWVIVNTTGAAGPGVATGGSTGQLLRKTSATAYDTEWASDLPLLGINATADTTNRLALAAPASLFNHAGAGHQLKLNKAAAGDTASLLYQIGFSGRAEMGLAGDSFWRIKVSANGSTWTDAVIIDNTTGKVGIGITAPANQLHVKDEMRIEGVSNAFFQFKTSGAGADAKHFDFGADAAAFSFRTVNDAYSAANVGFQIVRSGVTVDYIRFFTGSTAERIRFNSAGHTVPGADNAYTIGASGLRWASVWAANGTIQTSDARDKNVAARIGGATAAAAVDAIEPVMFRWKVGGNDIVPHPDGETEVVGGAVVVKMVPRPRQGTRLHAGFIAQEIKSQMDVAGVDFGVWGLEDPADPGSRQWLRPDQLIPVLWAALRETRAEVAALRARIGGQ